MKISILGLLLSISTWAYSQKPLKDFYLSHSLKQDNEQYQFKVLDEDKRGVFFYKKDRFYYWYKAQHVLATQGGASGTLLHGGFESFYPNKQLCRKGEFRKGLKEGEWLYWRPDGTLLRAEHWHRGMLSGSEKYYNERGEVIRTIEHRKWSSVSETADSTVVSRNHGKRQTISHKGEDGAVFKREEKKNGKLHGDVIIYDDKGKVVEKTRYRKGEEVVPKEKTEDGAETEATTEEVIEGERKWWQFWKKKEKDEKSGDDRKEKNPKEKKEKEECPEKKKSNDQPRPEKAVKEKKTKKEKGS